MAEVHRVCRRYHAAIELIGARWSGAILRALFTGQHRYAQIKAAVPGLSDTMLAERLRSLEADGLIERRVIPSSPVQVEYHLTDKGRDLEPVLEALVSWAHRWIPLPDDEHAPAAGAPAGGPGPTPVSGPGSAPDR
jgi:DNA-binding HxlR family transcriptional regulator